MKKTPKSKPSTSTNRKITSFFTKYSALPIEGKSKGVVQECVVVSDEDIIEDSPLKTKPSILDDVTNKVKSTAFDKKRKLSDRRKTDEDQQNKKSCMEKGFESYCEDTGKTETDSCLKSMNSCGRKMSLSLQSNCASKSVDCFDEDTVFASPKKFNNFEKTPEKTTPDKIVSTFGLRTPPKITPNILSPKTSSASSPKPNVSTIASSPKFNGSNINSPKLNGTTSKSQMSPGKRGSMKKKTPMKLFDKSLKVNEFQVEVLRNFVKVTPSKSEKVVDTRSPDRSPHEKRQQSILNYVSPSKSEKSVEAQSQNERTPVRKVVTKVRTPLSSKVKVKLDFSNNFSMEVANVSIRNDNLQNNLVIEENVIVQDNGCTEKNAFDCGFNFEDSWEENLEFTENYCLDLTEPQRCRVLETTKTNSKQTLILQSMTTEDKGICMLTDFWVDVNLDPGNVIFVAAVKNSKEEWIVDNKNGLLVYEPDFLVSCTSVVGAMFCKRKSILKDKYAGFDPSNKVMIVGNLVHSLLQQCLKDKIEAAGEIKKIIDGMLSTPDAIWTFYESSLSRSEIEEELMKFVPRIVTFTQQYMRKNEGKYVESRSRGDWKGKIDAVKDIEENIWCHELGIKGKVDVSVKSGDFTMPLELKTGRASMSLEHRGQIVLYIMMMNKLGYKVPAGLLLYLREGVLREIPMTQPERRDLILLRNELTYYLTRRPTLPKSSQPEVSTGSASSEEADEIESAHLPPPINHHSACSKCEYNTLCCVYLKHEKNDLKEFKHLRAVQEEVVSHLSEAHIKYFIKFSGLLEMESGINSGKQLREIYTKTPEVREKSGKCIINIRIFNIISKPNNLYTTTFKKSETMNLLASGIGVSTYVVVSTEKRPAVSSGIVSEMDSNSITIQLDRDLFNKYPKETLYHLDTYESTSLNTFNLTNLSLLMEATERSRELRSLIIDKEKPTFRKTLPADVGRKSLSILKRMNKMQQKAVIKALAANDYLLIKGMPGTGKTATIVALVQFLVELKQSVLITSHTHSAVDNVCIRLQEIGVNVLRLGSESRVHHSLKSRTENALTKHCKSPEELETVYNNAAVLAVTCIGSKHAVLSKRVLDVCIVDECTQVLQCAVIRALSACKKFVLIGDPDQLPPLVKNREAQARGLSESLFERLQSPESTVMLNMNYRMNGPITKLANDITYNGDLLIANDSVENANLRMPKLENVLAKYKDKQWLLKTLDDKLEKSVCVVDTGAVWNRDFKAAWIQEPSIERNEDDEVLACCNPAETGIVAIIVKALIKGGLSAKSIGVIAPYRSQVAQISQVLAKLEVDINTVDQFQGQDKEIIVYSCTKSRDISKPRKISKFEILEDQRRLTVAVTRAKHKLIVVADVGTVRDYEPLKRMLDAIPKENYVQLVDNEDGFNWEDVIADCDKP